MNKQEVVNTLLKGKNTTRQQVGVAFAPANIALCKYWGKRDSLLNLPLTNSVSISLGDKGATTRISEINHTHDIISVNHTTIDPNTPFACALSAYLDLFRPHHTIGFKVDTEVNIPIAAGLASSACGFAAVIKALDALYQWHLEPHELSVLARLGSGSACRSLWEGFVEWEQGNTAHGLDSHGIPLSMQWPEFRIGLLVFETREKPVSSRVAMEATVHTSPFYSQWPVLVGQDLQMIKKAIDTRDFETLGAVSEANALAMHALMMTARPSIRYSSVETLIAQEQVWACRKAGIHVYFTQDAGPNLKLLFLADDTQNIQQFFSNIDIIAPFKVV